MNGVIYAVISTVNFSTATTYAVTDSDNPNYNLCTRDSLDGSETLLKGYFADEGIAWLAQNGTVLQTSDDALKYLSDHVAQWIPTSTEY